VTHNLSGFRSRVLEEILKEDNSIIFLQESFHYVSSKYIFEKSNMYKTFHVSYMDETKPNKETQGGLITYVNTKIKENTSVIAKKWAILDYCTGNLVCINVYLPHANYKEAGLYDTLIGEIIGHTERNLTQIRALFKIFLIFRIFTGCFFINRSKTYFKKSPLHDLDGIFWQK